MSFLLRCVASSSSRRTPIAFLGSRFNSDFSSPSNQTSSSNTDVPTTYPPPTPRLSKKPNLLANIEIPKLDPDPESSDSWWSDIYKYTPGHPGTQFSGRSIYKATERNYWDFNSVLRKLAGRLRNGNVRRELQLGEYYEKPGDKKRRIRSERHRRRFQEMVRRKVQLVQTIRNRG